MCLHTDVLMLSVHPTPLPPSAPTLCPPPFCLDRHPPEPLSLPPPPHPARSRSRSPWSSHSCPSRVPGRPGSCMIMMPTTPVSCHCWLMRYSRVKLSHHIYTLHFTSLVSEVWLFKCLIAIGRLFLESFCSFQCFHTKYRYKLSKTMQTVSVCFNGM